MGKSKPRQRVKNRSDPTGKPVKPPADPELAAIREKSILPVLKDLKSPDLKTRSSAARAIVNIIEDEKCRKLLLREQIVKILLEQTLTDSSLETRTDGWGILRNLALEEEADFCIHLYRQDILTAIGGVVKTVYCSFVFIQMHGTYFCQIIQTLESQETPLSKLPKAQQDILWNLTSSIISLLSSLSEAQDEIVEAITKLPIIINFLFGLLAFDSTPSEVQHEVLSCLIALTEDNKPIAQHVVDNGDQLKLLIKIKDSSSSTAVPACGVLHNIFVTLQWFDHNTPMEGASDAMLIPVLVNSLDRSNFHGSNGNSPNSNPDQILQLALEIIASIATSLQEALEHGSRNEKPFEGFGDVIEPMNEDGEDMDEDEENLGDDDNDNGEMNDDEIDADMELVTGDGPDDDENPPEEVTLNSLVRSAARKILSLARPNSASTADIIQNCALSALNNIAWTISSIDFSTGHLNSLQKYWASLAQSIWNEIVTPVLASNTADIELASAITSLAWAVSRSVRGSIKIGAEEQRKFMALYQASKGLGQAGAEANGAKKAEEDTDAFQGLGVKCIGVLGSLALHPAPVELNREIGVFLLTVLSSLPDAAPADTVEALNQLFDIYADKSFAFDEPVFWGNNFYKHLEDIQPKAKKMAKSIDKRKFGELRSRADEAVLNLGRFLVYKRKEKANKGDD